MSITRLRSTLPEVTALVEAALSELREHTPALEQEARDAELAPRSRDLSAQKGAEERLEAHQERLDALEALASALEDARVALGR